MTDTSPPAGPLLEELQSILRSAPGQLGEAFRAIEDEPGISNRGIVAATAIANQGAASNIRAVIAALVERRMPASPSMADLIGSRVRGLLQRPDLSAECREYLLGLQSELAPLVEPSRRPGSPAPAPGPLAGSPVTLAQPSIPAGPRQPPPTAVLSDLEQALRADRTQLGEAFRAIEAEPGISNAQLPGVTSIANDGAAGNLRSALVALLQNQVPKGPSLARMAAARVRTMLRGNDLRPETVAYLDELLKALTLAQAGASVEGRMLGGRDTAGPPVAAGSGDTPAATGAPPARPGVPATAIEESRDATRMPRVFISYSRRDSEVAADLVAALREAGIEPWIDTGRIGVGARWAGEIADAIASSSALIVLLSRESLASHHVETEVSLAVSDGCSVIPVRIEEVQLTGGLKFYLNALNWHDALDSPRRPALDALAVRLADMHRR